MRSKLDLIMDTRYELGNIILYRYDKSMYISSIESDILIGPIQSYRSRFIIAEERENNNIVEHILIEGKYRGRYTISEIYIIIDLIKGWLDSGGSVGAIYGVNVGTLLLSLHTHKNITEVMLINTVTNSTLQGLYDNESKTWYKEPSYNIEQAVDEY